ncbi:hypothetical protein ACFOHW_23520 [Paenibacillus abyssi]
MNNTKMKEYLEELFETTGDLLYRVRIYDKDLQNSEEIMAMDDAYSTIEKSKWMMHNEIWLEKTIDKLKNMRYRLLTMMENLLYTA